MIEQLKEGPGDGCLVTSLAVLNYLDTKIKLHFSHFKLLVSAQANRGPLPISGF